MPWTCFWIEPTDRAQRKLRRFTFRAETEEPCPVHEGWGHDANVPIEDGPLALNADGTYSVDGDTVPHDDPRWPIACGCGYRFTENDRWQVLTSRLYHAVGGQYDGQYFTLDYQGPDAAPAGAMWAATWHGPKHIGPDGLQLHVRLPDGHFWCVDGSATSGGGWTREGQPPRITARPSILTPKYHGFLTDGVLSDDLEGRTYG